MTSFKEKPNQNNDLPSAQPAQSSTGKNSQLPEQKIVIQNKIEVPSKQPTFVEIYPFAIPFLTVVLSVWVAHFLTQQRDRDKALQDLLTSLEQQISLACDAASAAWIERRGPKRNAFVAQTKGRVQLIAASIERLKSHTKRYNFKLGPIWMPCSKARYIDASDAMIAFRREITSEPFDDQTRNADKSQLEGVELAKLELMTILQSKWADWAFGPIKSKPN